MHLSPQDSYLVVQDVVLAQVGMDKAAALVQRAHDDHHVGIDTVDRMCNGGVL
jgi:hypothetical protein